MKMTKRILALVLSVIMVLSIMPMAFATEECEHEFNEETLERPGDFQQNGYYFCDECKKYVSVEAADYNEYFSVLLILMAKCFSVYSLGDIDSFSEIKELDVEIEEVTEKMDRVEGLYIESEQFIVDYYTGRIIEITEKFDAFIEASEAELIVDAFDYVRYGQALNYELGLKYTNREVQKLFDACMNTDLHREAEMSRSRALKYLSEGYKNPENVSQEEFDCIFKNCKDFCMQIHNCLDGKHKFDTATDNNDGTHKGTCTFCLAENVTGEHTWGEYIPNGNSHCAYRGTKTATCISCTAKDIMEGDFDNTKHINQDGDYYCDNCKENVVERCLFCNEAKHEGYIQYVCMLKTFIVLLVNFFQSIAK
ncbi:MAG: hypothetical protein IKK60_02145 [Clostridia bacterium]|nr:hypothetical protein [Clostridia bacterium]